VWPRYSKRRAADADSYAERLLYSANVCVMLSEEVGEEPRVVEVKFERIVGDYLRNRLCPLNPDLERIG
jgi:hypothetical protein